VRTSAPASLRWEYAISRVDSSGRVADQSIVRTLAWSSAERVTVTARNMQAVVLRRDADGAHQLTRRRLIQIPAALRARCAIAAGDRVLLAAHPPSSTLIIYSMTSLERLLIAEHEALTCGARRRRRALIPTPGGLSALEIESRQRM